jgi:hypothetical protein
MGTDSIKLFDKALADQILAMDQDQLVRFLQENLDRLTHRTLFYNPVPSEMAETGRSVADAVQGLIAGRDYTMSELKTSIIEDFAFGPEEILMDYWGCYAANFVDHPEGAISSLNYLQEEEEERFVLLRAEHVAKMIKSLREHIHDVTIMDAKKIDKVDEWRALCAANPDYFVAYQFDF